MHSAIDKLLRTQAPARLWGDDLKACSTPDAVFGQPIEGDFGDARDGSSRNRRTLMVHFNRAPLDTTRRGSVLVLQLPLLGGPCRLLATDVTGSIAAGRVLTGRVLEDPQCRTSTLTLGPDQVYGTIITARGMLELEARGTVAWIFITPASGPPAENQAWLLPRGNSQAL